MSDLAWPKAAARAAPHSERAIAWWLILCCAMVFIMVVLGGITRLTESGLSITQWQPVEGIVPPLNEAQWQVAFDAYKAIPQYRAIHAEMSLAEFKGIFFWEYLHRLWGRLIGVVFAVPFLYFLLRRRIPWRLAPRLAGIFMLGGLQGALGWYMVESGLAGRIEVSQYRLAAHLLAAVAIYAAMLWVALDLLAPARDRITAPANSALRHGLDLVLGLVLLTLIAGAFTAGTRAGFLDNTFPLMEGKLVPQGYWHLTPWYLNWFENLTAVQFDHRLLAVTSWAVIALLWLFAWRRDLPPHLRAVLHALFVMVSVQAALGIATLLLVVPIWLAALHQAGALLLASAALVARHGVRRVKRFREAR